MFVYFPWLIIKACQYLCPVNKKIIWENFHFPQVTSSYFLKNHFIELWLICKKLYIFIAYKSMSLGISIHPRNRHYHQSHKLTYCLSVFPLVPVFLFYILFFCQFGSWVLGVFTYLFFPLVIIHLDNKTFD